MLHDFIPGQEETQDHILQDMKLLYPAESPIDKTKKYYRDKKRLLLWMTTAGILLALFAEISTLMTPVIQNGSQICRNEYGAGDRFLPLKAYFDDGRASENVKLQVTEQEYDAAEVEQMLEEVMEKLPGEILGDNQSFDQIRSNLKLVRYLKGYPFDISWKTDRCQVLNQYGVIQGEETVKEGTYVELTAVMTYADYEAESIFGVMVYPPVKTPEEELRDMIREETFMREAESRTVPMIELPQEINGHKLIWRCGRSYTSLFILFLTVIAVFCLYYSKDQELHGQVIKRRKQMELDYSRIISKMVLFLGAGMTTKAAWQKIVQSYLETQANDTQKRYAYEEMMVTYHEMNSGISETKAYEKFGIRANLPRYQIFASIISQGVKRGTQGTTELLLHEMSDAFEERKSIARQLGEEAGTKLLFPMFLMLLIVMVIIMVPALLSLRQAS